MAGVTGAQSSLLLAAALDREKGIFGMRCERFREITGDVDHQVRCGAIESIDPLRKIERFLYSPDLVMLVRRQNMGGISYGYPARSARLPWACTIGNYCLIGPNAHVTGAVLEDQVFIATGAAIFHGAHLGRESTVRVHAIA